MVQKQIAKIVKTYLDQGYTLCVDASFLVNASEVFSKNDDVPISISKLVFNELDQLKNANGSLSEIMWSRGAREGFTLLS